MIPHFQRLFSCGSERIGKRVEGSNGSIIDDYALSVFEKRVVGVEVNSRMDADICLDLWIFSLKVAIVVVNVPSLHTTSLYARRRVSSCLWTY